MVYRLKRIRGKSARMYLSNELKNINFIVSPFQNRKNCRPIIFIFPFYQVCVHSGAALIVKDNHCATIQLYNEIEKNLSIYIVLYRNQSTYMMTSRLAQHNQTDLYYIRNRQNSDYLPITTVGIRSTPFSRKLFAYLQITVNWKLGRISYYTLIRSKKPGRTVKLWRGYLVDKIYIGQFNTRTNLRCYLNYERKKK